MSYDAFSEFSAGKALGDALAQRDELRKRVRELLERTAQARRPCKACGTELFFVMHANGKSTPYTGDGVNHFIDCPEGARFKKENAPPVE